MQFSPIISVSEIIMVFGSGRKYKWKLIDLGFTNKSFPFMIQTISTMNHRNNLHPHYQINLNQPRVIPNYNLQVQPHRIYQQQNIIQKKAQINFAPTGICSNQNRREQKTEEIAQITAKDMLISKYNPTMKQQLLVINKPDTHFVFDEQPCENKTDSNSRYHSMMATNYSYKQPPTQKYWFEDPITLVFPKKPNLRVTSLIVTIGSCNSFDRIFIQKQQESFPGQQTLVYSIKEEVFESIVNSFFGKSSEKPLINDLISQIKKLPNDCVVFNWECCSFYTGMKFKDQSLTHRFIQLMLKQGFMLMFSDFSLKALINSWNESILGPNPFIKIQECNGNVLLRFDPATLKKSPSTQLQLVGSLSHNGVCNVHVDHRTIGYVADQTKLNHNYYKLDILTVATNVEVQDKSKINKIKDFRGSAGHTIITYPNGGKILTSMTHWIELMKIDTTEQKLLETAQNVYGQEYIEKMKNEMVTKSTKEKSNYIQQKAINLIHKSSPCGNSEQRLSSK